MKVSILSAVYNESKHIAEMIESVLYQSHEDFELLFADDGSTDNTVEIISSYQDKDARINLVSSGVKLGKVRAFNLAFSKAIGDYFILLAGDDLIPHDSLKIRVKSIRDAEQVSPLDKIVSYSKLETFSDIKKFDGMIIPRGDRGNRSGGTFIMNRNLAEGIFPIDERLPNEDSWLSKMSELFADQILDNPHIVLKYRIHSGNSNPRQQGFAKANGSLHARLLTYQYIVDAKKKILSKESLESLLRLATVEDLRYGGAWFRILLFENLTLKEKMFYLFHSTPLLFKIRTLLFKFFSGR